MVDKPAGMTSHDVVARLRKIYGQRRVGHAGTLDPDATGVLLVGLGRATRLLRYLQETGKSYRARIVFGVATDTLDASGAVFERAAMSLTREQVEHAARAFVGEIAQIPPMVSAIKVDGRKLYELRAGRRGGRARAARRPHRLAGRRRLRRRRLPRGGDPHRLLERDLRAFARRRPRHRPRRVRTPRRAPPVARGVVRARRGAPARRDRRRSAGVRAHPGRRAARPRPGCGRRRADRAPSPTARPLPRPRCSAISTRRGPFAVLDERAELVAVYERRGAGVKPSVVLASQESA